MDSNKIREEAWDLVRDVIYNNVVDPLARANPNWINASFPDIKNTDFPGYPLLVLSEPTTDWNYTTLNQCKRTNEIAFVISVFTTSSLQMSTLCDSIDSALRSNNPTFQANNLSKINISDSPQQVLQDGKKKIHLKQFTLRFTYHGD